MEATMAKVSVNTYNAIVPHKESNVNAWFGFDLLPSVAHAARITPG
jgi:hypothetical protein